MLVLGSPSSSSLFHESHSKADINIVHTLLLVDLQLDVDIEGGNDQVASDIEGTDAIENIGVVEGNALRHLHHPEDDDDVDTVACMLAKSPVHSRPFSESA